MSNFHPLKIKNIIKETADAVSIVFDVPENLTQDFSFIAGQYITLKAVINGEEVRRAYSLCSSPNSNVVKVAVKAVENGKFSVYATTQLKVGDVLEVSKPEGKFVLEPQKDKNYLGFAAGSGITPLMAMVKTVLETEATATFTLIYGNKSSETIIFNDELTSLLEKYPSNFKLQHVLSRAQQEGALQGRIDKEKVGFCINDIYKDTSFDAAFLCGPEEMVKDATSALTENGFAGDSIFFELFTVSIDEEAASAVKDGETEVTVLLDDEEVTFTMSQKDDLLAGSLRNNLDAPYSCQGGVCSSCLAKVTEGKAVMTKNPILTEDELEEGLILTCQAHAVTPKITIDFDDV